MTDSEYKRVLGLELPTDPRWVNLAEMSLEEILTDHAFCEQKAASTCISLIQKYSDYDLLVEKISPIVSEEWSHFRVVLRELKKRNLRLGKQRKDEYVNALIQFVSSSKDTLLNKLLVCAMIEARSCERFRLLSKYISEEPLREFYHQFMVSEAGHYKVFLELAACYFGEEKTRVRWMDCLNFEADILQNIAPRGDRMH